MNVRDAFVTKVAMLADQSWCRLVQSSAGAQVVTVYGPNRPLADHLAACSACSEVADGFSNLTRELEMMHQYSWTAPPDFVDRVMSRVSSESRPNLARRSTKDKVVLACAGALSGTAVIVAAMARRRRTAA